MTKNQDEQTSMLTIISLVITGYLVRPKSYDMYIRIDLHHEQLELTYVSPCKAFLEGEHHMDS